MTITVLGYAALLTLLSLGAIAAGTLAIKAIIEDTKE